jgi:hypothetical protein
MKARGRRLSAQVRGHANRGDRWTHNDTESEDEAPSRPTPSLPVVRWLLRPDPDAVRKPSQRPTAHELARQRAPP